MIVHKLLSVSANLFIVIIVLFASLSINAEDGMNYSKSTLIIKFKAGTELLAGARELTPKNYHDRLVFSDPRVETSSGSLSRFMEKNFIRSIWAAKPDADLSPLPGGMERIFIIELFNLAPIESIQFRIAGNPQIEYAEFDHIGSLSGQPSAQSFTIIPNDPSFTSQWGLRNTGQVINSIAGTPGGDINAVNAWDITTGSSNLKIAVLDSGIPLGHPEFAGRLLQGYDYANNDNNPTDDHGHGTNVASIIGAKGNNNSLMAGVNWNCKIIPIKILAADGTGFYSWWVSGITYAVDNGAKVLNMSVGGSSTNAALSDAVIYAQNNGRIVVACMMNNNNNVTYYPAGFANVISIGATNNRNQRAVPFCWGGGSSFGPHIDFAAPGEMILGLNHNNQNSTNYWCGTSQATPMTVGTISLMLSVDSTLTLSQIYNTLKASARDQVGPPGEDTPGFDNYFGWGLINARGALDLLIGITQISTTVPESFSLYQNYPNPFNPATKIRFDVPSSGSNGSITRIVVFDAAGRKVETIVNKQLTPGTYETDWNASGFTSGVYFYRLENGKFMDVKKMILIK